MTRDEAIAVLEELHAREHASASDVADVFERLGMLKLDDPELDQLVLETVSVECGFVNMARDIIESLHRAGLKVVRA